MELNLVVDSDSQRENLLTRFDELWAVGDKSDDLVRDVKEEVLKYLEQLYKDTAPEFVYLKTLYHIFENYLSQQQQDHLFSG